MKTRIVATGSYVPPKIVTNKNFETIFDTNDAWIKSRTGIKERHYEEISNVNMAVNAAKKALHGIDYESIDCIIVGTYTSDTLIPGVANSLRHMLGIIRQIPAFDVNAACSGFMYALHIGHAYIQSGIYRKILVIGSDFNSKVLNFNDRGSSILFGDGAGAVVIEPSSKGILGIEIGGLNDTNDSLVLKSNNDNSSPFLSRDFSNSNFFEMKGGDVFKFAVSIFERAIKDILVTTNLLLDEVDYVIAHQANQRILDIATKNLGIDKSKVLSNVANYGNTSSGSVPLLLDQANSSGLFKPGMKLLLVAFGGGLTYGVSVLEW